MSRSTEPDLVLIGFDDGDVVWGERLEPGRAILRSIPSPQGGFRWLDQIVVVPEAVTEVELSGVTYQMFAAYGRAEGSGIPTVIATVGYADRRAGYRLTELLSERGWRSEDWTEEVRIVCASCIDAPPDATHHHVANTALETRTIAVAGRPAEVGSVLRRWQAEQPVSRRLVSIDEAT